MRPSGRSMVRISSMVLLDLLGADNTFIQLNTAQLHNYHPFNQYIYIYIPAKPKTQEFQGQSKITSYLDTSLEISRAPLKFGFWGKNA